jgi:hypothetical protein
MIIACFCGFQWDKHPFQRIKILYFAFSGVGGHLWKKMFYEGKGEGSVSMNLENPETEDKGIRKES